MICPNSFIVTAEFIIFLNSTFSTVNQVLEAARHMVAMQIARDPLVRQCVRQTFYERAKLKIKRTKKGKKVKKVSSSFQILEGFCFDNLFQL